MTWSKRRAAVPKARIRIVSAEASYHSHYDHATTAFLAQAGVSVDHIRLEHEGQHGNGHMMMLEKNNHEIADILINWLDERAL